MSRLILVPDPPGWSAEQSWAYALGAPYHVRQGFPVNALPQRTESILREHAPLLKRDWDIEGGEQLLSTLNWLGTEGHRRPLGLALRRYCMLPREQIAQRHEELRLKSKEDAQAREELWRLEVAQRNTDDIRGAVLIAFDASRAVMLARYGYLFGWLTERQLWDYVLDVARDVQRRFTSWAEYASDFRLSRSLWAGSSWDSYDSISKSLLTDARSPWQRLPWPLEGLAGLRPVRRFDSSAPVWMLEQWNS